MTSAQLNGHPVRRPKMVPRPSISLEEAIAQEQAMSAAKDWSAAKAAHLAIVHAKLSGFLKNGSVDPEFAAEFPGAVARVAEKLSVLGDDTDRMLDFLDYAGRKQKRARARSDSHRPWGHKLVFGSVFEEWVTETAQDVEAPSAGTTAAAREPMPTLLRITTAQLFEPLPEVPYLVRELDLCAGAPALLAGYGFSGKTLAAASLAVSVATGLPVWGRFAPTQRGRVLHLDYEQGRRINSEHYQRLTRGMGASETDLGDRLSLVVHPWLHLDGAAAEDVLSRETEGHALLVVDSLRAAAPDVEENSSDVRRTLDMLGRVSERTGVAVLVVHHARKPARDSVGGAKMAIRGSGAIFDACGSVVCFAAEKDQPIRVSHEKARSSGMLTPDFSLAIRDVELDGDERAGLTVTADTTRAQPDASGASDNRVELMKARIVEHLRERGPVAGKGVLRAELNANRDLLFAAVSRLVSEGVVVEAGTYRHRSLQLASEAPKS